MSQRDHELTASATADTPSSVPASPPPLRDSMEDADPSLTRKRPRLDSGPIDDSAMHMDDHDSTQHSPTPADQLVEMTIRSQPPSSHAPDPARTTATPPPTEDIQTLAQTDPALGVMVDGTADSPPVIAIDDDDDDGRDTDAMTGYAAAASFHVDFNADHHISSFPFMDHGDYLSAAQDIAKYFHGSK